MKPRLVDRFLGVFGLARAGAPREGRRAYDAAQVSRIFDDWIAGHTTGDAELRASLRRLIARMRDLARNNDYVRGYLGDLCSNVIGSQRFDLRMDAHDVAPGGAKKPDRRANLLIEQGWARWSTRRNASPSKCRSWRTLKRQALRSVARDGAVLVHHIRGAAAKNAFGYAVELLEIDQLDLDKHENLPDGGSIRFGVEKAPDGEIRAFHVYRSHPGDDLPRSIRDGREVVRVPASEMHLLQLDDRITETLSVSWFVSCATRLRHLGGYEEAEVIAARIGACKGGFFTKKAGVSAGYAPDADSTSAAPHTVEAAPGQFEELPAGLEFQPYDPTHPTTAFGEFRKAMLRGIGVALGCSYTTLGNDLESVNYSSARVGILDEREVWKELQTWFTEEFLEVVFGEWLLMALTTSAINLPLAKFEKFNTPIFKARRWAWVDPLKDLKAAELGIALRTTSRRQIIDENGGDVEDVFRANKDDELLADELELSLAPPDPTPSGSAQTVTTEDGTPINPEEL